MAEDRERLRRMTLSELPTEPIDFPDGFVWGTAACAHQTEGGNWNSDWWAWEHDPASPCVDVSGDAIDHYNRFDDDFALFASLGHNAHRFSVEWARIEPEPGEFSTVELDHYSRVVDSLHRHGLEPFMTLHHFSSPRWVAADGGWANPAVVDRFRRFADMVAKRLGDRVKHVCTINEPQVVALGAYQGGDFPPGANDRKLYWPVTRNFIAAHQAAVEAVKTRRPDAQVGITLSITDFQPFDDDAVELRNRVHHRMVQVYLDAIRDGVVVGPSLEDEIDGLAGSSDFLGVQYYSRAVISKDGVVPLPPDAETTQMGYEVVPDSFVTVLTGAMDAGVPLYVTENGIGTSDDRQRISFLARHLAAVREAMDRGADIRGYLYWCPIDNFEWALGYGPTFGLIACDRSTFERTPKPSASYYGEICRSGRVDPARTTAFLEGPGLEGRGLDQR